ncbi:hypothetical protein [Actinocrinis sp.]|uniref:hypothetical protein n=1 Tax=Actinocrinis sp. TaxID=1920516 RepID=UPI002D5097BC|nr:hypothetical protein [Actinocrinis sp.]HZP54608.1 hypothetical protein [Actinocrinis sp.]
MDTATNTQAQTPLTSQICGLRHTPLAELARTRSTDTPSQTGTPVAAFQSSI